MHTGRRYSEAYTANRGQHELTNLRNGCDRAVAAGLRINAGHGLTYWNVYPIAGLPGMEELNIGHSIRSHL